MRTEIIRENSFDVGLSRLYRHPDEALLEIGKMRAHVSRVKERLNSRNILMSALDSLADGTPEVLIPALVRLTFEAEGLLFGLREMAEEIGSLMREVEDVRCRLMI